MGFDRLGPRIRKVIEGDLRAAARRDVIYDGLSRLYLDSRTIHDYTRKQLKKYLLAVMGSTWWEQDDAIRAAARYLGFRRAGPAIQRAFRSAINGAIRQGRLERDRRMIRAVR